MGKEIEDNKQSETKNREGELPYLDPLTEDEIEEWKEKIDNMSHEEMARHYRFKSSGESPVFDKRNGDLYEYFMERFEELGGMTTKMSKRIGW